MKHIVTFTINPAIDKNTTVEQLVPEQKMRCTKPTFNAGGGGINVSRAIHRLGGDSLAVFTSGGHTGFFLQELLAREEIRQLPISIAQRTRENFIVVETSTNQQYRFGLGGPSLNEQEWQQCLTTLAQLNPKPHYLVASGSLNPGVPTDFFARVARIAHGMGARFVLDTSDEALELAVNEGVYLLKPNLNELRKLVGAESLAKEDAVAAARQIIDRGNCEVIVVSLGEDGAMLVSKNGVEKAVPPKAVKRSTVGAGDSMVAGMVYSLSKGKSLRDVLHYGVACGTAATMNVGTELCHLEDVEHLHTQLKAAHK